MSSEDYTACAESIGAVYHCAADVRHFGQWETSYAVNTEGTRNVIHFCQENGAVLHHVSTVSVNGYILTSYGKRLTDVFTENHLYVGQRYKENIYVHSKYLAEKAVIDARSQGLRANIYRVGNLLWRACDGQFQKNREAHDFYMLTHAFLQLGAVSTEFMDLSFDMTAVDLCAEAIGTLSTGETGMIYHLMNPHQVTLIQYLNAVSETEMELLPLDQLEKRIREQPQNTQLGFLLSYLLANKNNQLETFPREGFDFTVDALAQKGFRWDPPSVQFMKYVL
jgi:thioester reductase-like protein